MLEKTRVSTRNSIKFLARQVGVLLLGDVKERLDATLDAERRRDLACGGSQHVNRHGVVAVEQQADGSDDLALGHGEFCDAHALS
jgi:hypothetical protein